MSHASGQPPGSQPSRCHASCDKPRGARLRAACGQRACGWSCAPRTSLRSALGSRPPAAPGRASRLRAARRATLMRHAPFACRLRTTPPQCRSRAKPREAPDRWLVTPPAFPAVPPVGLACCAPLPRCAACARSASLCWKATFAQEGSGGESCLSQQHRGAWKLNCERTRMRVEQSLREALNNDVGGVSGEAAVAGDGRQSAGKPRSGTVGGGDGAWWFGRASPTQPQPSPALGLCGAPIADALPPRTAPPSKQQQQQQRQACACFYF